MAIKTFVLDTSAIIALVQDITTFRDSASPGFAGVLGDNEIVIPRVVFDELDHLNRQDDERAFIAREAAKQIENYGTQGCLINGVETEKGGLLRVSPRPNPGKMEAWNLQFKTADHQILATALELDEQQQREPDTNNPNSSENSSETVLITQDRILRILARSLYGMRTEELRSVCAPEVSSLDGYQTIELSGEKLDKIIQQGYFEPETVSYANQFFYLVDKENPDVHYGYAIAQDPKIKRAEIIDRGSIDYLKVAGEVAGRNIQQRLFLWSLMGCGEPDPMSENGVRLITVSGPAGSGKSFLTLAAAWERLERGHFERIVVTRPMVDVGTSLGFLPGTLEEKLKPWGGPIEDNLRAIVQVPDEAEARGGKHGSRGSMRNFDAKAWLEMENRLELVPLTYIRGRTFRRSIVILEEAQNLERGPLKVLLTRLGEGSICVIVGDQSQIDNQFLSRRNNGLNHAINAFRDWPQAIHITLKDIVRSDLAEAASHLL